MANSTQSIVPIVILSESDDDVAEVTPASSQNARQSRKRNCSSNVSDGAAKGSRFSKCEDCHSICAVQVDRTPSNFGRKVISPDSPLCTDRPSHHTIPLEMSCEMIFALCV
jgi:DnaJ-class molecular chaperone